MTTQSLTIFLISLSIIHITRAKPCPRGTFIQGENCIPCPPGTFNSDRNQISCQKCSAGSYNRFSGAGSFGQCLSCLPGTFSKAGATECISCPPGKFSRRSYTRCLTCPPGEALLDFTTGCAACPAASYRPVNASSFACLPCPSGTGSLEGATSCKTCRRGTFRDNQFGPHRRNGCRLCPKNSFTNAMGTVQCKLCPLGTVSDRGAVRCKSCPAGSFRAAIKQNNCEVCSEGTTSVGKKPAGCKDLERGCPVNTFEDRSGECRACMPGERVDIERKKCVSCGGNQVSLGGVSTECKTCPPGQRPANANSIFEKSRCECDEGTVSDHAGGCRKCPPGTHWSVFASTRFRGTFVRSMFYTEPLCQQCEKGSYNDKPGMTECKTCPVGTYTDLPKSTECTPCPDGFVSPAVDISLLRTTCILERSGCELGERRRSFFCDRDRNTSNCPPNTAPGRFGCIRCFYNRFYDAENKRCRKCPRGEINPEGVSQSCIVCPKGAPSNSNFGTRCTCLGLFENDGEGSCRRCPRGELSTIGKCGPCPENSFFRMNRNSPVCIPCVGNTIKLRPRHRRCTKCRDGFVKERDVLGEEANRCIPADLYPVA